MAREREYGQPRASIFTLVSRHMRAAVPSRMPCRERICGVRKDYNSCEAGHCVLNDIDYFCLTSKNSLSSL